MKKSLPKLKKSLKSFILEEDAKVIDKSLIKITITAVSTVAILSACGSEHCDHANHTNAIFHDSETNSGGNVQGSGVVQNTRFGNDESEVYSKTYEVKSNEVCGKVEKQNVKMEVDPKSVKSTHANHYNRTNIG